MRERLKKISASVIAVMVVFSSCTAKEQVEDTDATVTEVMVSETTEMSELVIEETTEETSESFNINEYSFDTIHGSQLNCYLNHQYYFAGQSIPVVESNYYFIKAFMKLSEDALAYGYYPVTSEGYIDLAAEIPVGDDGEEPLYKTYGDMFKSYAETSLYSVYIILDNANLLGVTLSDEDLLLVNSTLQSIEMNEATPAGLSLEDYLKVYYGPECTVEAFKQVLINYYINDAFTRFYLENFDYGDMETIVSPTIRYASFKIDGEDSEELELAKANAEAMLAQCYGSLDTFKEVGENAFAAGECTEFGDVILVEGQVDMLSEIEEWSYSPDRKVGDLEILYIESYGYILLGFVRIEENQAAMEQIAVDTLTSQINANITNNTYGFYTTDEFFPPMVVAPLEEQNEVVTETTQNEEVSQVEETTIASEIENITETEKVVSTNEEATSVDEIHLIAAIVLCAVILVLLVVLFVKNTAGKKTTTVMEEENSEET